MPLIAVMGTTASGKTDLAEALADTIGARLINSDAFQVYRHLDIGTAKSDRKSEYSLIDIKEPNETFGVGEWCSLARAELERLFSESRPVVVVGGTGLNVRALFEEYSEMAAPPDPALRERLNLLDLDQLLVELQASNPAAMERIDLKNPMRVKRAIEIGLAPSHKVPNTIPPFRKIKFGLERDSDETNERIAVRVERMMLSGWVEEVRNLRDIGFSPDDPGMRAHGYRHIWQVIEGKMDIAEAADLTTQEVRRYAKRQRTWLRKEPGLIRLEPDNSLAQALREIELIEE